MEHIEEISCIRDGTTGVCRGLKDKKARASIEALEKTVNTLAGVDGGHLATDEDIKTLANKLGLQVVTTTLASTQFPCPKNNLVISPNLDLNNALMVVTADNVVGFLFEDSSHLGYWIIREIINPSQLANAGGGGVCFEEVATITQTYNEYGYMEQGRYIFETNGLYKISIYGFCVGNLNKMVNECFDFHAVELISGGSPAIHTIKTDDMHYKIDYDAENRRFYIDVLNYYPDETIHIKIFKYKLGA